MRLWNTVIPTVFVDARSIDFPHALGLHGLSRILFGGFRGRGGGWGGRRSWARWQAMTPEGREQMRGKMRCGGPRVAGAPGRAA